jgi:DNA-binding NarL/FixJ family response regulator
MSAGKKTGSQKPTAEIMIIEDDPDYRKSIKALLNENRNFVCSQACESCEEALDFLKNNYVPQVILLDIELPGMSGIECIPLIRKITPNTKIIILTIYDDDDKIFSAICQGASGYLLKATPSEKIYDYLNDVLCGGAVMSPFVADKVMHMFSDTFKVHEDYALTQREKEILKLLIEGHTKKQISEMLNISQLTVETHIKNIYSKLHVHTQVDLVSKVIKEKLV